ncbi:GNAT family N-acetyltransferase [Spirosoma sp. BT702]|uniref:GNAT family N-acetyltransferase n=1 Tax=Spirosoma profusum TaxID=2771354 RepID=A0A926XY85_9BACT|nr:GNAT family N-acetyltransferase [Spirosoma profusum]MBD2702400.1 GNAT family N-acetyltransferase [Spirosoma profusum]
MIDIRPIPFEQTYQLRHKVLWPDKPFDYVKVENDSEGYHFGAFQNDELVAVISLFVGLDDKNSEQQTPKTARFRKFAARPDRQRQGIGTLLLNHVIAEAKRLGATTLWCDARLDAADFYRRFDMEAVSDIFYKGPIPYAKFSRTL